MSVSHETSFQVVPCGGEETELKKFHLLERLYRYALRLTKFPFMPPAPCLTTFLSQCLFWPLKFSTCYMAFFPSGPLHMLSLPREHLLSLLYTRLSLTSLTDLHLHITLPTELSQMPRPGESGSAKVPMATCVSPE